MLCKGLSLLPIFLYLDATLANPMRGSHHKACHGGSCTSSTGNSALQTRAQRVHASAFFEEGDEDDGAPIEPGAGATAGKSLAQTGMKRDHTAEFVEEDDDG